MGVDDQGDDVSCCHLLHQIPVHPSICHTPHWEGPASPAQRDGEAHPRQHGPGSDLSPRTANVMEQELAAQGKGKSSFHREGRGEKDVHVFCSFPLHRSTFCSWVQHQDSSCQLALIHFKRKRTSSGLHFLDSSTFMTSAPTWKKSLPQILF